MQKIFKQQILPTPLQAFKIQKGARILNIQMQESNPCIWYIFDVENECEFEDITIETIGTGHFIDSESQRVYIGMYQVDIYVFHVFQQINN